MKKTRTQSDPHYAKVNRMCQKRCNVYSGLCVAYVKKNYPEVFQKMKDEAYRMFPPLPKKERETGSSKILDALFKEKKP